MNKNFPVGDWFPSKLSIRKFEGSTEATQENPQPRRAEDHGFKIHYSRGNTAERVVVSYGVVGGSNSEPISPPQVDIDIDRATEFSYGKTLYLNITIDEDGQPTSANISTSKGTVSKTKAVAVIGSVSNEGEIVQILRSGGLTVFSCGENNILMATSFYG
jgi:hypothetical protein